MMIETFQKVTYTAIGYDAAGKRKQKTFWQTLNPYNKAPNGDLKSRNDVLKELHEEANIWIENLKRK